MDIYQHVKDITGRFPPITLEEMDGVKLMDRTDTKFVFRIEQLPELLEKALPNYRILEIANLRSFRYESLYFDTPCFRMYHDHHRGKRNRYKVRYRRYMETGQVFLEVKYKKNTGRTIKKRMGVSSVENIPSPESLQFIGKRIPLDPGLLEPKLWTCFNRFTLVHHTTPERITLDIRLSLKNENLLHELPWLAIAEVKQESSAGKSDIIRILSGMNIKPGGLSKYCLGTVLLYPGVKTNLYKRKIRFLTKLQPHDRIHPFTADLTTVRN